MFVDTPYLLGPMKRTVMQRNVWKVISNLQRKRLNNCTTSQHHAWMTIISKKKKLDRLETCHKSLLTNCSRMLVSCSYWLVCEQTCSCGHEMDKSMWKTFGAFDLIHSSHKWIPTILLCGRHSTTVQAGIVSRLWLCGRSWGLKIIIRRSSVHFRESHVCANKLDVQETDFSFTQFYRSWNHLSRCRCTHRWDRRSRSLGFSDWSVSFFTKPNQQIRRNLSAKTTKHAETEANRAHWSRSAQYWSRSIKRDTFWF